MKKHPKSDTLRNNCSICSFLAGLIRICSRKLSFYKIAVILGDVLSNDHTH